MKVRLHHLMPLVIAVALVGVAAPPARAGHQDLGTHSAAQGDLREDGSYFDPSLGRRVRITPRVTIVEPSGFDWGDAGVGAVGAFGLMLLAGGVVIASGHSHRIRRDPDAEASAGT